MFFRTAEIWRSLVQELTVFQNAGNVQSEWLGRPNLVARASPPSGGLFSKPSDFEFVPGLDHLASGNLGQVFVVQPCVRIAPCVPLCVPVVVQVVVGDDLGQLLAEPYAVRILFGRYKLANAILNGVGVLQVHPV